MVQYDKTVFFFFLDEGFNKFFVFWVLLSFFIVEVDQKALIAFSCTACLFEFLNIVFIKFLPLHGPDCDFFSLWNLRDRFEFPFFIHRPDGGHHHHFVAKFFIATQNLVFQGCFLIDNGDIHSYQFA